MKQMPTGQNSTERAGNPAQDLANSGSAAQVDGKDKRRTHTPIPDDVLARSLKRRSYAADARGPLSGVRVIDLSRLFAGNVLTQILGDFGAEVIKVEPPAGDTLRAWKTNGIGTHWKIYVRNKKSLCLDLHKSEARALLLDLLPSAGFFIESFRPGTLEKMGLAPRVLHSRNPKLVVVRISGWGQEGPYCQRPGFGTLIEGMSGFAALNGFADREPVLPPMYLADGVAGLYGASAAMIALREVEIKGGRGQVIDLPLLDPLFAILGPQAANYRLTGKVRERTGSRSANAAPRNAYRCKDGKYVGLSASTQKMAERTFRAIGRHDLVSHPNFRTNADRVKHAAELDAILGAFLAQRTQAENVAFLEQAEVTVGPIYDISQIVQDPHVIERELIADYPDADMGLVPMHPVVPRLLGTPGAIRHPAPLLGEHNRPLLSELGVDAARYTELLAAGVACEGESAVEVNTE
jgi:formyl-CoA transferase